MLERFSRVRSAPATELSDYHLLDLEGQLAAINRVRAVIEFDPNGHLLAANKNFQVTMGYSLAWYRASD